MLVGRQPEIERIESLLASARTGESGALVLRGDPGVGKTALLRHSVEQAGSMVVLRASGFESEAELEFSGLVEVCRPLLGELAGLPPVQAAALSSALGLTEPTGNDRFIVAAATLSLVAGAADTAPVLVVVDDAHWLDHASLDALLFAARRLVVDPVAFLFATRPEGLVAHGLEELELQGLDRSSASSLLIRSAGGEIAPEVMDSLLEAAAGNPLGLIELPGGLSDAQRTGREPLFGPLPAGALIERAFAGRLAALGAGSRQALAVLAAADGAAIEPAQSAFATLEIESSELTACEDARIVTVNGDRFAFAHPLLRAAAYQAVSPSFRRAVHRALASAVVDVERQAWHLALAAVAPDDEAADALEQAALSARAKSAPAAAAAALQRAAGLASDERRRQELTLAAAEAAWESGAPVLALDLAEGVLEAGLDDDGLRARALGIAGRVELQVGMGERALARLLEAADLAASTDPVRAARGLYFACLALYQRGRIEEQISLARRAVELDGPETVSGRTVSGYMLGQALTMAGRSEEARPWLESALETFRHGNVTTTPLADRRAAFCLMLLGRAREAAATAEQALARSRTLGPLEVVWALATLGRGLFQTGDWTRAKGVASEALELGTALGQAGTITEMELLLARIAAARGDETDCSERLERSAAHVALSGNALNVEEGRWARGRIELVHDRLGTAVELLTACVESVTEMGMIDVDLTPEADLVEALVRAGRVDEAAAALERWIGRGAAAATPWAPPLIATCRGLLAGESEYDDVLTQALSLHADQADPYLEARARLVFGERLRRSGRRVDAREQLRAAHASFERLGAAAWASRAARELRASGERLRSAAVSGDELTPQEREIALQVASGKANKEVAAALFLSPKTVEFHLSRVYRKLGIASRTELVLRFAGASV